MEGAFLANVVVSHGSSIFQALSCENQPLLVFWDTFLVMNLPLDGLNAVSSLDLDSNGLSCKCAHKNLHSSPESEYEMESTLLSDVIVCHCPSIFEALSSEDKSLLAWGDSFFVLNFGLDSLNGVSAFDFHSHSLSCQCSHKDLHSSSESEDHMNCALLLYVVVSEAPVILKLFACEDESLLVSRNSLSVLDELLEMGDAVSWLHLASHGLPSKCLHEDLHLF